jgi:hypothetical protein
MLITAPFTSAHITPASLFADTAYAVSNRPASRSLLAPPAGVPAVTRSIRSPYEALPLVAQKAQFVTEVIRLQIPQQWVAAAA